MHKILPSLIIASFVVMFFSSLVYCEESSAVKERVQGVELGFKDKIIKKLNPSVKCPHCGKEFSENRSMWMLIIGFLGQAVFTSRFVVQWIASERRKESYIPHIFWYLSIIGSIMLLSYAVSIRAWPVILGQMFGVIVYSRNLVLIARKKKMDTGSEE
jgi:lipid-A-disaccharide synthase-like uncharacterized protein